VARAHDDHIIFFFVKTQNKTALKFLRRCCPVKTFLLKNHMDSRQAQKRYRDLNTYLKSMFGGRVQKIALDAGLTCPNRDGRLSSGG